MKITAYLMIFETNGDRYVLAFESDAQRFAAATAIMDDLAVKAGLRPKNWETGKKTKNLNFMWGMVKPDSLDQLFLDDVAFTIAIDQDQARDAARWRALMSSQRMHFMGAAAHVSTLYSQHAADFLKEVAKTHIPDDDFAFANEAERDAYIESFEDGIEVDYAGQLYALVRKARASVTAAPEDALEERRLLVCSTGCVPKHVADEIMAASAVELPFAGGHYGNHGWFSYAADEQGDIPDELYTVLSFARANGFDNVLFDQDASPIDGLPFWEW